MTCLRWAAPLLLAFTACVPPSALDQTSASVSPKSIAIGQDSSYCVGRSAECVKSGIPPSLLNRWFISTQSLTCFNLDLRDAATSEADADKDRILPYDFESQNPIILQHYVTSHVTLSGNQDNGSISFSNPRYSGPYPADYASCAPFFSKNYLYSRYKVAGGIDHFRLCPSASSPDSDCLTFTVY